MYSESQNSLWSNELLKALTEDPGIGDDTKRICQKLKYKSNQWQSELREMWASAVFPAFDQADILKLNTSHHKNCQRLNTARQNQRNFYSNQGHHATASLIPDVPDDSVTSKHGAIVQDDFRSQGWNPLQREYVTIAYHKKASLDDMLQRIDKCVQSQAINIPKSISNIILEGQKIGYTAQHYNHIWLAFIQKHLSASYISALTYSMDTEALFEYLLSLVDTSTEVKKIRDALAAVIRKQTDPIATPVLKVKSLTTSLLFMLKPNEDLADVDRRSTRAAQDSIFSFVNDATKEELSRWKRRANEMGKTVSLNDFMEACNAIELLPGFRPAVDMSIPGRFSQADLFTNAFYAENNINTRGRPEKRAKNIDDKKNVPRDPRRSDFSKNRSGDSSRQSSRGRSDSREGRKTEHKQTRESRGKSVVEHQRGRSKESTRPRSKDNSSGSGKYSKGSKGNYKSSSNCKKCGSESHASKLCLRYPFFYEEVCKNCPDLYHPTELCRFKGSRYRTPEKKFRDPSPKSFRPQSSDRKSGNIFVTEKN